MTIKQSKASSKTTFEFQKDKIRYTLIDSSGDHTISVDYDEVPNEYSEFCEKKAWFRNAGILWIVIGLAQAVLYTAEKGRIGSLFWFFIGVGCCLYYLYSRVEFKIFDTPKGRIFIIKDKKQLKIENEIEERKRDQIKRRYGRVIDGANPEKEASRFNWMLKERYINQDEFEDLMAELRLGIVKEKE